MLSEANEARTVEGITAMMEALPLDVQWRLGITSADPFATLQDDFFPLLPGDDAQDALQRLWDITYGPGEAGLAATHAHIREFAGRYGVDDWMRRDAVLLVVAVSDEEDQSYGYDVQDFVDWFRSERVVSRFIPVVATGENECEDQYTTTGLRYMAAATALNSPYVDFCQEDWAQAVADIGSETVEPIETFELNEEPYEDSIVVEVNHLPWSGTWEYLPDENAVFFVDVPPPGSFVTVGYLIAGT